MYCSMFHVALTYTAAIIRLVVVHDRSVVDDACSCIAEAAAVPIHRVSCASNSIEYDQAVWIPPEYLRGRVKLKQRQRFLKTGMQLDA